MSSNSSSIRAGVALAAALALDSELMRFPGAYLHYKRRIKS
jgi:hypothetical protein